MLPNALSNSRLNMALWTDQRAVRRPRSGSEARNTGLLDRFAIRKLRWQLVGHSLLARLRAGRYLVPGYKDSGVKMMVGTEVTSTLIIFTPLSL